MPPTIQQQIMKAFRIVAAGSNNATSVKSTSGNIQGWAFSNTAASARYVKIYRKSTAPAPASDASLLLLTIAIPAGGVNNINLDNPISCANGIGLVIVTGAADTDNTAVTANDVVGQLFYI